MIYFNVNTIFTLCLFTVILGIAVYAQKIDTEKFGYDIIKILTYIEKQKQFEENNKLVQSYFMKNLFN